MINNFCIDSINTNKQFSYICNTCTLSLFVSLSWTLWKDYKTQLHKIYDKNWWRIKTQNISYELYIYSYRDRFFYLHTQNEMGIILVPVYLKYHNIFSDNFCIMQSIYDIHYEFTNLTKVSNKYGTYYFVNVFLLFLNYLPLEKGGALHLNKLESPLPKDALY